MAAFLALLTFLFAVSGSLAKVYITEPVADTKWNAGDCVDMGWIDDGHYPHIWSSTMEGEAVGELYSVHHGERYIASVSIETLESGHTMFCLPDPCSLWYDNPHEMRILSGGLESYSHTFTITNTECLSSSSDRRPSKGSKAFAEQDVNPDQLDSLSTAQDTNRDIPSSNSSLTQLSSLQSAKTTTIPPSSTAHSLQQSTVSTIYAEPLQTPGQQASFGLQSHRNAASSRSKISGRWMDLEKIKFRLVFIVWPALVGISMAL
ncbi:hypothetical protein VNI00_005299 [Paramarasmius palmivorus]|uniref:Uncharacterized protein n=1 Tax=Paramarasmius palmivorus TaxID=297713 RepID=A0AAW0DDP7_9AGAR